MEKWIEEYNAAEVLQHLLQNGIKGLDDISGLLETEPEALALFEKLTSEAHSLETVDDLNAELEWIRFINNPDKRIEFKKETMSCGLPLPVYYEKPNAIAVTDTDFITYEEIISYSDYLIAMSVIYSNHVEKGAYEIIIQALRQAGTNLFRKICLKSWRELVERILNRLEGLQKRFSFEKIIVRVPFFSYEEEINRTIARYKNVLLILDTLAEENLYDDKEIGDKKTDIAIVPSINRAFQRYAITLMENNIPGSEFVRQEMFRRGLMSCPSSIKDDNGYRIHLLGDKSASVTLDEGNNNKLPGELVNRVGVLYCMLNDVTKDRILLTRIAHFALNDAKPFILPPSENTVYSYIAHPKGRLFDSPFKRDFIEKKLEKYGIAKEKLQEIMNTEKV